MKYYVANFVQTESLPEEWIHCRHLQQQKLTFIECSYNSMDLMLLLSAP